MSQQAQKHDEDRVGFKARDFFLIALAVFASVAVWIDSSWATAIAATLVVLLFGIVVLSPRAARAFGTGGLSLIGLKDVDGLRVLDRPTSVQSILASGGLSLLSAPRRRPYGRAR